MKVLYDISVLGLAQRERWQRTGVFRTVDEVARNVVKTQKCEVLFCCAVVPSVLEDAVTYVGDEPAFMSVRMYENKSRAAALDRAIPCKKGIMRFCLRGMRALLRQVGSSSEPFTTVDWERVDVFHAPAFFLPPGLPPGPRVEAFLTIYDLVPILQPELCRTGSSDFMQRALASLTPDRWAFCISEATKQDLCNYLPSLAPERVFVTPLAASDKFYPCEDAAFRAQILGKYGIPDAPYFLSLSTLEPRKNMDHLIRCFSALSKEPGMEDINLVLVGERGWKYEAILEIVAQTNRAAKRVILAGYVADDDLAALYSGALGFVYPSLYEGFGLPPLEAMKCGIPVIVSNTSSLPEVVGDAGLSVSPTDSDALSQALLEVARDSSLRRDLSARSIEQAKKFSWEKCAGQTVTAYEKAVRG